MPKYRAKIVYTVYRDGPTFTFELPYAVSTRAAEEEALRMAPPDPPDSASKYAEVEQIA